VCWVSDHKEVQRHTVSSWGLGFMGDSQSQEVKLRAVDRVEVVSLVDNSVDLLSASGHPCVKSFRQWTKHRSNQSSRLRLPLAEHGFSMYVKVFCGDEVVSFLFDAGMSGKVFVENAEVLGLELGDVDFVVLSHGHYDHFGGLLSAVELVGREGLPLIVHEDMFKQRGTSSRGSSVSRYPDFPDKNQLDRTRLIFTKDPYLAANGCVCVTGEIPRLKGFEVGSASNRTLKGGSWRADPLILDDRAIVLHVGGKGLVVLSGCAHAGIINTINYAQQITGVSKIYAVLGGFHLAGRNVEDKIRLTIDALVGFNPFLIVPSHCTGWHAEVVLARALPEAFVHNSVGNLYSL
jgi:7,8-dihydropterin-6-yl-methyl-4-(beta-D-ribofuranosyl)aminobenzene 5'-phosphate synthase